MDKFGFFSSVLMCKVYHFKGNLRQQNKLKHDDLHQFLHYHLYHGVYRQLVILVFLISLYHCGKSLPLFFQGFVLFFQLCFDKTFLFRLKISFPFDAHNFSLIFWFTLYGLFWILNFNSSLHTYFNHWHQHKQLASLLVMCGSFHVS